MDTEPGVMSSMEVQQTGMEDMAEGKVDMSEAQVPDGQRYKPGDSKGDQNGANRLDAILKDIRITSVHEDNEEEKDIDPNLPLVMLAYGELYAKIRMVYWRNFSPERISPALEPRTPFVAADMAESDTNFFAWFDHRGYNYLSIFG